MPLSLIARLSSPFATILAYLSYQNIWAEAKRKVAPVGPLDPANKVKRTRASKKAGIDE